LVAVAEFLMEVNPRLPAFWYSLEGNGPGSLSYLFGMCEEDFRHLFMAAGVLNTRGDHVRFHRDRFEKGFDLLVGNMPNGIEAASCKLDDPKEKKLCNKAPRKMTQWFILVGLSTSSWNWTKYPKACKQIVMGIQPPSASLNLSRQLFRECECIHKSLLDKVVTASTTERSTQASRPKEEEPMAFDSPPPQTTRPKPTIPTVTPSALLTVQEDTAVAKDTPFFDRFVGKRDKYDKEKLTGVLKETVDMLALSKHKLLQVMSANGKETLISMVPKRHFENEPKTQSIARFKT
jgi:hypothetical protein